MAIYNTNIIISMLCLNRLKHSYIHPDLRRRGPRLSPAVVGCDFLGFLPSPSSCSATPQTHPFFRLFRLTNMTCLILCLPFIIHPSRTTQLIKPTPFRSDFQFFFYTRFRSYITPVALFLFSDRDSFDAKSLPSSTFSHLHTSSLMTNSIASILFFSPLHFPRIN
jgi:hypothetical protein